MASTVKRIWFVSRKFPPRFGGMEVLASMIADGLSARGPVEIIAGSPSRATAPLFLAYAFARVAWGLLRNQVALLYLGDPALAALTMLASCRKIPVVGTVHGLDILYPQPVYQWYLRSFFWRRYDAYVCISRFVADTLHDRGVALGAIRLIPPGIPVDHVECSRPLAAKPVLLLLGRLVPRKGAVWFVKEVFPKLLTRHPDTTLVIAGSGDERAKLDRLIGDLNLGRNVRMLEAPSNEEKMSLFAQCDAVLMPNVPTPGDVEGFGIVALEANAAAKPVFASDVEGLRDAIRSASNGWRLPAGDAGAWLEALDRALADRTSLIAAGLRARHYVKNNFEWSEAGSQYADVAFSLAHF